MVEWVTSNDTTRETWRRLREFANLDIAEEAIARVHGPPTPQTLDNYRKQARQIRASILQAAEYFDAAHATSLSTRPNHLYYGLTSLASSMMLLLGDGTRSFDALRKDGRNMRHGIGFTTACTAKSASVGLSLLQQSHITIEARGHFANWYSVLPAESPVPGLVRDERESPHRRLMIEIGTHPKPAFEDISGSKHTILGLMSRLPDLYPDLLPYRTAPAASRINKSFTLSPKGTFATCIVHNAHGPAQLDAILDRFQFDIGTIPNVVAKVFPSGASIHVRVSLGEKPRFRWPDARTDMAQNEIMYAEDVSTPEIVDQYLSAFALSMLCRYYPDLWFSCLDSNCKAAQLVEAWSSVAAHKAPMLALSILTGRVVIVSSQKNPL